MAVDHHQLSLVAGLVWELVGAHDQDLIKVSPARPAQELLEKLEQELQKTDQETLKVISSALCDFYMEHTYKAFDNLSA
jgi:hypothetical protein